MAARRKKARKKTTRKRSAKKRRSNTKARRKVTAKKKRKLPPCRPVPLSQVPLPLLVQRRDKINEAIAKRGGAVLKSARALAAHRQKSYIGEGI